MNKNLAKCCGVAAAAASWVLTPMFVNEYIRADSDVLIVIYLVFNSFIAMCLGVYLGSKDKRVSTQSIGGLAILNIIGIGIAVYCLLIDDTN